MLYTSEYVTIARKGTRGQFLFFLHTNSHVAILYGIPAFSETQAEILRKFCAANILEFLINNHLRRIVN